jgi:hypothetical protein
MFVVRSAEFRLNPDLLSLGVTADISLGIPLLYYLFIARRTSIPATTVVPVFLLSVFIASRMLPSSSHKYLDYVKLLLPLVEAAALIYVLVNIRRIYASYRKNSKNSSDFTDALRQSLRETFKTEKGIELAAAEISTIYYGLFAWFKKPVTIENWQSFSYHRKTGSSTLLWGFLAIVALEIMPMHLILQLWNEAAAWIFTGLGIYTAYMLLANINAMRLRPILVSDSKLAIRVGLFWSMDVNIADVEKVELGAKIDGKQPGYLRASLVPDFNVLLTFKRAQEVVGFYGFRKRNIFRVGISVDEPQEFGKGFRGLGTIVV